MSELYQIINQEVINPMYDIGSVHPMYDIGTIVQPEVYLMSPVGYKQKAPRTTPIQKDLYSDERIRQDKQEKARQKRVKKNKK